MTYQDPEKLSENMKAGLARMYADNGFRSYLINAINIANQNVLTCVKGGKPEEAKDFAARMDALEKLLEKGRILFTQFENIKRLPLEEQVKLKENAINQTKEQESIQS